MEYPDKNILPLKKSFCPNMYKINLNNLLECLENIGQRKIVTVDDDIRNNALVALENMLTL